MGEGRSSFGGRLQGTIIYVSVGSTVVGEEPSAAARGLVRGQGGKTVSIFLMPTLVWGERHTLSVAEAEVETKKVKLGANSEEVK